MNDQRIIDILIIEDNKSDADLLIYTFKKNRIKNKFFVIYDGEDALNYLFKRAPYEDATTPDLIILDLNLPRVHGHEILRQIKSDTVLRSIPTIILTTSVLDSDVKEAYTNYANAYLTKPLDFESFVRTITTLDEFWLNIVKLPPEVK